MSARERQEGRHGLRAAISIAALALALFAASCANVDFDRYGLSEASAARDDVAGSLPPEQRKEHERLIAAYGGVYHSPELEALISHTVDRLVVASEKPELKYRVTLLNSSAINAFALPGGTLYVTRGLVALANDTSELSSVLAHEMAHQWFGDLVTLAWWDEEWLNESMTFWMEHKETALRHPEWRIWEKQDFFKERAMRADEGERRGPGKVPGQQLVEQRAEREHEVERCCQPNPVFCSSATARY